MRRNLFLLLRLTGIPFFLREFVQRRRVTILCYHDIDPSLAESHFRELKRLYNIIPLNAYINARRSHSVTAIPEKALIITFDDGHKGNYRLLPLIKQHQVPITIFLCSSIVGTQRHYWWLACPDMDVAYVMKRLDNNERLRHLAKFGFEENRDYVERQSLSRTEIEELTAFVDFQAHSCYHPILTRCANDRSWNEIMDCKTELENNYGLNIYAFAYPNGDYSTREAVMAKKAGYSCALTIDGGFNTFNTDMFRLKRLRMNDEADLNELIVKASGLWSLFEGIIERVKNIRVHVLSATVSRGA